ncbi:hypothetical protein ASC64_04250 [Nocardioides sp. Root122]|nr:hypothetical protein ASC64_04250 [Nocardioides sp. Root122]
MAGVLLVVTGGLAAVGGLVTAQRRAQAAADLAALAAAATSGGACAEAARTASANDASLVGCRVAGQEVAVVVAVPGPVVPWRTVRVTAEARAGPG